jgi:hypothetical protein
LDVDLAQHSGRIADFGPCSPECQRQDIKPSSTPSPDALLAPQNFPEILMHRPTTTLFALASVLALSVVAPAQNPRPDFSGTWVLDAAKSQAPMLPQSAQLVVAQSDKLLSIEHTASNGTGTQVNKLSYHIDGSPSKNSTTPPGGQPIEFNSTTEWSGRTLVITTTADFNGGFKQVERWTLSSDGKQLTVLGDIALSGQTATAKMLYDKKP